MAKRGPSAAWTRDKRVALSERAIAGRRPSNEEIVAHVAAYRSMVETARWSGLTRQRVSQIWLRSGGEKFVAARWTDQETKRVTQLALDGHNAPSIASRMYGFTENAIRSKLKKLRKAGKIPVRSTSCAFGRPTDQ